MRTLRPITSRPTRNALAQYVPRGRKLRHKYGTEVKAS